MFRLAVAAALLLAGCASHTPTPAPAPQKPVPPPRTAAAQPARAERTVRPSVPTPSLPPRFGKGVGKIISSVVAKNDAYRKLTELCDGIGHRLSGSKALERAIAWAAKTLRADGHENVRREKVMVERWLRGPASLQMLTPRTRSLPLLALGGSVSTPRRGVTAELVVVDDWKELEALGEKKVRGRIVLFNARMLPYSEKRGVGYGRVVQYRYHGAARAANLGALAALVRSPTAHSLRTPHTGAMSYRKLKKGKRKIAAAAITTEDADLLARLQRRGVKVKLRLRLVARSAGKVPSANVIAELRGREKPDEVVLIGGHIDSWDVGQGAHDDGGGCVMAMEALSALRRLGMRPRRTVRVVLFTNEENGLGGARAYARDHRGELAKHVATIEADTGVFDPRGFSVSMKDKAAEKRASQRLERVIRLLAPLEATRVWTGHSGADLWPMKKLGVVTMGLRMDISHYFDYHHTRADTLDKIDRKSLGRSTAALAAMTWLLAELPGRLDDDRK